MTSTAATDSTPWYEGLMRGQWLTLLATNLGWLFDGFETYALVLTVGPAMRALLPAAQHSQIPAYAGTVMAITLLGWGIGGLVGGVLADYVGRKRMMVFAILAYSIMTGLTALSTGWLSFALLRFLVGIAIGSEWATGSSIMAEIWPPHARGKGASLMQCGFGVGFFIASFVWVFLAPLGPQAWRYMFLLGALPALLTLWIRIAIPESAMWQQASESRRIAAERQRSGAGIGAQERALTRFTMVDLFAQPDTRRLTIIVFLMSLTTTLAWWSISTWIPPHVASLATKANLHPQQWASYAAMTYNAGGIAGYALFGFFADVFGRKPVVMIFFAMSLILTPVLFLSNEDMNILLAVAALNGFFTLGQYSWMPVWLPELFPTRMRATAVAFAFNAPRFVAFVGPLLAGTLIVRFGGYGKAAVIVSTIYILGFAVTPFLPETRGRPLPT